MAEVKRRMVRTSHPYSQLLAAELDLVLDEADGYLLGEHLAETNDPVHVKDFIGDAATHGLGYVCELLAATPEGGLDIPLVTDLLRSGMARADAEQCLDVLTYRQFRATLLWRREVPVAPTGPSARRTWRSCSGRSSSGSMGSGCSSPTPEGDGIPVAAPWACRRRGSGGSTRG
jgi:hypothetical protein